MDLFHCPACRGFLWDPVTVSCGHSFCKRCLGSSLPSRCQACRQRLSYMGMKGLRSNVVLASLLDKCLDRDTKVSRLKSNLRDLLDGEDYQQALKVVQKGVDMDPEDVQLRIWRSEVHVALKKFPEALEDLEVVCRREPEGFEGFYRKGKVLLEMGEKAEALHQFHHCLTLNPHFPAAQKEIEKILSKDLIPQPAIVTRLLGVTSLYLKDASTRSEESGRKPDRQDLKDEVHARESQTLSMQRRQPASLSTAPRVPSDGEERTWKVSEDAAEPGEKTLAQHFKPKVAVEMDETCSTHYAPALQDLLSISDFECSLCIRMFYKPVTTPCGHTFCKECLERCLDHKPSCPLCKQSLREYLKVGKYHATMVLENIMSAIFPLELADRRQVHETEMAELSNLTVNIPIFVCTMAFPGIMCPLHIFEPRYRLMMRRCQETGLKMFGMCLYEASKGFADFGCMLEIQTMTYLADGRSHIETVGRQRFRVLRRGQKDGYHTADIEYLEDEKVEGDELAELCRLHDHTYQQVEKWFSDRADVSQQIFLSYGPLPAKEDDIQQDLPLKGRSDVTSLMGYAPNDLATF
ncbi:LON peptidase N-terminal domain and RING finger protein 1-like isoform X2 [Rhinatrema bivittatum]|uniref:LON peptidase N-terminal domain and RING finger protein 1-like isoform X2 n=1 Tax=Rhinatrema bivittatum TaxID=194408 RepID=UPI00112BD530|nr:LON peptidase N-terminal domain and RING finger protein 1-like isoform X2 [Rhinatrema bivittatum]